MIRREVLTLLAGAATCPVAALADGSTKFSTQALLDEARRIAAAPYQPRRDVPKAWRDLTYGQYRGIQFDIAKSIWRGTDAPMTLDVFPPGAFFTKPVDVMLVEDGVARSLPFDLDLFTRFDFVPDLPETPENGFAGIRLRTDLHRSGSFDEYAVFQGASYFRMIGAHQRYGLSARGLAVGTASRQGEEFPEFTKFWVERAAPGAQAHKVHALLESPSVTGLYHFTIYPGDVCEAEVTATLFPRAELSNFGIAPLTSMFLFDESNRGRFDDYRRAVHDSEGLNILNGNDELLWRPLTNHNTLQISHFMDDNPRGFGLMQRSRRFAEFDDLEARFDLRPSLWITPSKAWGPGSVTLVEIPADRENFDNIVAYWTPSTPLAPGSEHRIDYLMSWGTDLGEAKSVAPVTTTLIGRSTDNPEKTPVAPIDGDWAVGDAQREVRIDFAPHDALPADWSQMTLLVRSSRGRVSEGVLQRNPDTGGPRLAFSFDPGRARFTELRAELRYQGRAVSEVWLYRWTV